MSDLHPDPPGRSARLWGGALTLVSVAVILFLTLTPVGPDHQLPLRLRLCLVCGEFGLANLLRNVMLFVPLGAGLALLYARGFRAWIPAIVLTVFIETAQIFIPGRNPLLADVLANAAGGGLGILFVLVLRESLLGERAASATPVTWGRAGAALWIALPFLALLGTAYSF
ncbi:MAG: VanZ family protein, partial [Gemmatimonadota bacterium]